MLSLVSSQEGKVLLVVDKAEELPLLLEALHTLIDTKQHQPADDEVVYPDAPSLPEQIAILQRLVSSVNSARLVASFTITLSP